MKHLKKIYLVILGLLLVGLTFTNFAGRISSPYYNFWGRVGIEIIILIALFLLYLFLNWFYKCAVKTVLCLTENQVYKEENLKISYAQALLEKLANAPLSAVERMETEDTAKLLKLTFSRGEWTAPQGESL